MEDKFSVQFFRFWFSQPFDGQRLKILNLFHVLHRNACSRLGPKNKYYRPNYYEISRYEQIRYL